MGGEVDMTVFYLGWGNGSEEVRASGLSPVWSPS